MKLIHEKLGACEVLITFQSAKNQLALVTAYKTVTTTNKPNTYGDQSSYWAITDSRLMVRAPKFWLLWGDKSTSLSSLGKTCLLTERGNRVSQGKAMKMFMSASKMIDNMEFKKLR